MVFLQIWAGGFYLANKVFFAIAETQGAAKKRQLKIYGWLIYILGVPPWLIILASERNWIAVSVEAGGIPAMLFGLYNLYRNLEVPDKNLDRLTSSFTYAALVLGLCYSFWDRGGLTSLSQLLEISAMTGFLLGTYLLAKGSIRGWLFFMLMNMSMATLLFLQDKVILSLQQLISLGFVVFGFCISLKHKNTQPRI